MALIALRKLNLQTRVRRPFVYFHTLCVRTAKALARLSPEPSLFAYATSTIISWAVSIIFLVSIRVVISTSLRNLSISLESIQENNTGIILVAFCHQNLVYSSHYLLLYFYCQLECQNIILTSRPQHECQNSIFTVGPSTNVKIAF